MADDWQRVGRAIAQRIATLSLSKAEVIRRSGVSDKTLTGYIDGQPIVRADKRRQLCEALGWTPDSIDALLAGGDPVLAGGDDDELAQLRAEIAELRAIVELVPEMQRQLEELRGKRPGGS